ncbi:MAG TPA: hypothetical protein PKC67_13160 [Kiritimatiellia bacterium]|nr:hypothetical protein [Kiritimatiellia bacterium]
MKRVGRSWLFWVLLLIFAAGSVWWTLVIPRDTARLLQAIPGQAMVVSWHSDLAGRWPAIAEHPLTATVVGALQADQEAWTDLRQDPGFLATLDLIGRDDLVLAYVPHLGLYSERAWVFAGWIGGRSQRLRWSQSFLDIPGLSRMESIGGWPVWTWVTRGEQGTFRVTLALVEGMILGCTARDPMAIEMVIDAYNGLFPSIAYRKDLQDWNALLRRSSAADRFWVAGDTRSGIDRSFTEVDISDAQTLAAAVRFFPPAEVGSLPAVLDAEPLAGLWGDAALATAAVGVDAVVELMHGAPETWSKALVKDVIVATRAEAVALAVFGGDYSGRFKGIKVPTLMAALQRDEGGDVPALVTPVLDRWNARTQWGLVLVPLAVGTTTVWRIEATAGSMYAAFGPSEQVAITAVGDWLVVSSNLRGLDALVRARDVGAIGGVTPLWSRSLDRAAGTEAVGYLGIDLVRGHEALRLAITAYALKLLFEDASGTRAERQRLNEAKAWLETLATLEQVQATVTADGPYLRVDIRTGKQ